MGARTRSPLLSSYWESPKRSQKQVTTQRRPRGSTQLSVCGLWGSGTQEKAALNVAFLFLSRHPSLPRPTAVWQSLSLPPFSGSSLTFLSKAWHGSENRETDGISKREAWGKVLKLKPAFYWENRTCSRLGSCHTSLRVYTGSLILGISVHFFFIEPSTQPEITTLKKGWCPQSAKAHFRSWASTETKAKSLSLLLPRFETPSHCMSQAGAEVTVLLLQPAEVPGLGHHGQLPTPILMPCI